MNCRHCNTALTHTFLDLGFAPPSNAYLSAEGLTQSEKYYPLKLFVCDSCWLVQTEDYASADELFSSDYAYFSSVSSGWLAHAKRYVDMITAKLNLDASSFVVELASNDGYLLKNFVADGIPCLGIEPTQSTADAARKLGVSVLQEFFGETLGKELAEKGQQADLILGNNVYAHVPDINDFTAGITAALKPSGVVTLEFPHLVQLINNNQFDTVYHEHFSYLSLTTVASIFECQGLKVFDVEELPTHGGSLRVYGCHASSDHAVTDAVGNMLDYEKSEGLADLDVYSAFQLRADAIKNDLVGFLIEQKRAGNKVVAYGAAAKGNTLLNYGGVKPDLLEVVFDAAPSKQNQFMPGSHIPILSPSELRRFKPDFVVVLPWNIVAEVKEQHAYIAEWGGRFVTAVPGLKVH